MHNCYHMNYWVITSTEDAYGPYECEEDATSFGTDNLDGVKWTITTT